MHRYTRAHARTLHSQWRAPGHRVLDSPVQHEASTLAGQVPQSQSSKLIAVVL
jgi:hypothetical protein